jgi:hypothetical protein
VVGDVLAVSEVHAIELTELVGECKLALDDDSVKLEPAGAATESSAWVISIDAAS